MKMYFNQLDLILKEGITEKDFLNELIPLMEKYTEYDGWKYSVDVLDK